MRQLLYLKNIRKVISIFSFIAISFVFIAPPQWLSVGYVTVVTWLQFIPSAIQFTDVLKISAAGFIAVFIITFFGGRLYCSVICPLGTLQDIFSWLARRIKRKEHLRFSKAHSLFRYSSLAIILILLGAGSITGVLLLDPYSNFGRIMASLIRPVMVFGGNITAGLLESFDVFALPRIAYKDFHFGTLIFSALFLLLLIIMSVKRGRLFCNTLCPVGTLLGVLSKVSFLRIRLDESKCNSCGKCSKNCKSQCIDVAKKQVDYSRCVTCFNCLDVCPSVGVSYTAKFAKKAGIDQINTLEINAGARRRTLKAILVISAFSGLKAYATRVTGGENPTTIPEARTRVSTPPGSENNNHFNARCTACQLCVTSCPTQVLQPSLIEYGIEGFMQPYMNYHAGFCNYECTFCGEACPTGAIQSLKPDEKKLKRVGLAKFIEKNCVVYTDKTDCGACSEHCPTKAVNMVPYEGKLAIPRVDEKICIGCGACEFACPTRPYRAIFVEGIAQHEIADKPLQDKIIFKNTSEDFPF